MSKPVPTLLERLRAKRQHEMGVAPLVLERVPDVPRKERERRARVLPLGSEHAAPPRAQKLESGFPALLTEIRKRRGVSQAELARRTGFTPSYINRLESGSRSPSRRPLAVALADGLGLEPNSSIREAFLARAGYAPDQVDDERSPMVGALRQLEIAYREATTEGRLEMDRMIAEVIAYGSDHRFDPFAI